MAIVTTLDNHKHNWVKITSKTSSMFANQHYMSQTDCLISPARYRMLAWLLQLKSCSLGSRCHLVKHFLQLAACRWLAVVEKLCYQLIHLSSSFLKDDILNLYFIREFIRLRKLRGSYKYNCQRGQIFAVRNTP